MQDYGSLDSPEHKLHAYASNYCGCLWDKSATLDGREGYSVFIAPKLCFIIECQSKKCWWSCRHATMHNYGSFDSLWHMLHAYASNYCGSLLDKSATLHDREGYSVFIAPRTGLHYCPQNWNCRPRPSRFMFCSIAFYICYTHLYQTIVVAS